MGRGSSKAGGGRGGAGALRASAERVHNILAEYAELNGRKINYDKNEVTLPNGEKMTVDEYNKRVDANRKAYQKEADIQRSLGVDLTGRVTREALGNVLFDEQKAGKTYQKLPDQFKRSIRTNLQPSEYFVEQVAKGSTKAKDEWTTGLRGIKEKRKVITSYNGKDFQYTVKNGNKILLRNGTKEQAANQVAMYYDKYIRQQR